MGGGGPQFRLPAVRIQSEISIEGLIAAQKCEVDFLKVPDLRFLRPRTVRGAGRSVLWRA
jgi:hypothetical protein